MDYIINGELQDDEIIAALKQAIKDYKNGDILSAQSTLIDIVDAINLFDPQHITRGFPRLYRRRDESNKL